MISRFKQFLSSRDVKPSAESTDEYIQFKYNDLYYVFVYDNSSPNYFRLILPRIYQIEDNELVVYRAINTLNRQYKAAKTVVEKENDVELVWVCFEQFAYSMNDISELFATGMSILRAVFDDFQTEINNQSDAI